MTQATEEKRTRLRVHLGDQHPTGVGQRGFIQVLEKTTVISAITLKGFARAEQRRKHMPVGSGLMVEFHESYVSLKLEGEAIVRIDGKRLLVGGGFPAPHAGRDTLLIRLLRRGDSCQVTFGDLRPLLLEVL